MNLLADSLKNKHYIDQMFREELSEGKYPAANQKDLLS